MMSSIHLSNFVILCQQFFARGTYWLLHLVTLSQRVTCKSSKKGESPAPKSCEVMQSCLVFQILVGSIRCLHVPKDLVDPGTITSSWLNVLLQSWSPMAA